MLPVIATAVGTVLLLLLLAAWSSRGVRPVWPAAVFALACLALSLYTGPALLGVLPIVATTVVAFVLGLLFFLLLRRAEGSKAWWVVFVPGALALAFLVSWRS